MPRKKVPQFAQALYHVGARSNNQEWFYVPIETLWKIFLEQLQEVSVRYHAHVIAFVLMTNHYHLLLETPEGNLGSIMNYLQREVSRSVGTISGRINHVFGGTYRGTLIDHTNHLYNCYRYIYQNPVAAGICQRVESYPYSSLKFLVGGKSPIALADGIACSQAPIPIALEERVAWLNQRLSSEQRDLISRALKKPKFAYPRKYELNALIRSLGFDADGFPGN